MPALREVQAAMRAALLGGDGASAEALVAEDGLAPAARLAVYRHHVLTTLTEVLRAAYPVVRRLVDDRFFAYAAHDLIRAHPPAGPCLAEYGAALPGFLAAFPPCRHLPWLPDVARLEWALHAAVHAKTAEPLAPARLRALPAEALPRLRLRPDPSITLIASPWPIDLVWRANRAAGPVPAVDLAAGPRRIEVRRAGDEATLRVLDDATFALRAGLAGAEPLGAAAAAALCLDARFDLPRALGDLLAEGWAVDYTLTDRQESPQP